MCIRDRCRNQPGLPEVRFYGYSTLVRCRVYRYVRSDLQEQEAIAGQKPAGSCSIRLRLQQINHEVIVSYIMNFNEYFALSVGEGWDKSQKREIKIVISDKRAALYKVIG